jgi:hypothetical protein
LEAVAFMANGTTGTAGNMAGGASPTDINSTLKNIVSNIGQEAQAVGALGTTSASTLLVLQGIGTTLQAIATALATTHTFGGALTLTSGTSVTTVLNPKVASNASIVIWPSNGSATTIVFNDGISVSVPSSGEFLLTTANASTASGTETFFYVGFNP